MATEQKDVDDDDIMDFLNSKGLLLEPFKREFLDCEKELESVLIRVQTRERENVKSFAELNGVRDQVSFIRRNIDELQIAQESIRKAIDPMIAKRNSLADKERHNRDEIRRFSAEYEELKVALSVGADWSPEQLEQRQSLEKEHQFLLSKVDNKNSQVSAMRNDVDRLFSEVERLEKEITNIDATTTTVDAKIKTLLITGKDNLKLKESEEKKIFEIRNSIKTAENSVLEKQAQFKSQEIELNEAELSLKNTKQRMEDYIKEYDDLLKSLQDFTSELEKQKHANEKLQEDIDEKKKAIAEKNKEIEWYNKEQNKIIEMKNIVAQKSEEVNAERIAAEEKRETLTKQQSHIARVEINSVRKQIETHDKQIAILKQELEMVKKRQGGSERNAKTVSDLLQANHNGRKNLALEQKLLEEDVNHQKNQIRLLLAEKEKFEHEIEISNQQYYTALEELKLQEMQIQELQNKIRDDLAKLKHKQNLYEGVRSDRNLYSKQLVESQDEILSLKRTFRNMNHQIDQLKDEITAKDHAIVKEHFLHHSVDKERELLKNELTKIKKQLQSSDVIIENQRVEMLKLNKIVDEAEKERSRQRNELSSILAERNLLTSQVIKRNFELTTLYDRIKLQRSNLKIGERQFNKYNESISEWKRKLKDIVYSNNEAVGNIVGMQDLKNRIVQLERDILTEKSKTRALQDELEKPMNVHRWRTLESSDPKRFEKISQIQMLQKRLISKSDQVVQLDLLIQEKEKVYVELKHIIARQPGAEVEEQLLAYQQTLKEKNKHAKDMDEELDMYRQQVQTFKEDIEIIDANMAKLKKKWFKMQKENGTAPFNKSMNK